MQNRRRTRVESEKNTTLRWGEEQRSGTVANVSLKGCLVHISDGMPAAGDTVTLVIHLEEGAPELDITLQGSVVRAVDGEVAVDFTEIPSESFPHLFRLVQYNADDPEGIEGELGTSAFEPPEA